MRGGGHVSADFFARPQRMLAELCERRRLSDEGVRFVNERQQTDAPAVRVIHRLETVRLDVEVQTEFVWMGSEPHLLGFFHSLVSDPLRDRVFGEHVAAQ